VEKMTDADRVYPGLGAMDLKELKASLDEVGYGGYLCLELFNRDYWKEDPAKVAQDGRRSIKDTFGV
jgi:2-keto-myo-inositol isomerase